MESRWIDQYYIVDRNVRAGYETQETSVLPRTGYSGDITLSVDCTKTITGKNFHIFCIFNKDCVTTKTTAWCESYESVNLYSEGASFIENDTGCNYVISIDRNIILIGDLREYDPGGI